MYGRRGAFPVPLGVRAVPHRVGAVRIKRGVPRRRCRRLCGGCGSFLRQHPVNYPSYSVQTTQLTPLASIEGLPTTIYIGQAGKVAYVHTGQYANQKSLDSDIADVWRWRLTRCGPKFQAINCMATSMYAMPRAMATIDALMSSAPSR